VLRPTSTGQVGRDLLLGCTDQALRDMQTLDKNLYGGRTHDDRNEELGPASLAYQLNQWVNSVDDEFKDPNASGSIAIHVAVERIKIYETAIALNIKTATNKIAEVDEKANATPGDDCARKAQYIYEAIRLTNPHRRLQELRQLSETLKATGDKPSREL